MNLAIGIIAGLLAVVAVVYFRAINGAYWRKTGYAMHIAAWNTLVLVGVLAGVIALAWWLSTLCFGPGIWRNTLAVVLYSVLMGVLGQPAIGATSRFVVRWYYM
jgi:hypothetical protein